MTAATYYRAGARLRAARKALGLLQWELAAKAGIGAPVLSAAENGRRPLSPRTAAAVAPLVRLSPSDLTAADQPRPALPRPVPAFLRDALAARSHRDIPAMCPCDWEMQFTLRRAAGWALTRHRPGCAHHREVTG